ncbi:MAG: APC family permease [Actinomycetes bacterium]|nr:MAG: DNA-binding protein [Actinomycetota bacterium]
MAKATDMAKRLLLGPALRSGRAPAQLLPKRIALPVFASDALSSVAYAPQEILITLGVAGFAAYHFTPWIAGAVLVVLLTVVASYRHTVRAYQSGGGDFEVAMTNLGPQYGIAVAAALLVDYVLTVAVSISSAVENLGAVVPFVRQHEVGAAIGLVVLLTLINLRGVRDSGLAFALPTYAFVTAIFTMLVWGAARLALGEELRAETADYTVRGDDMGLTGLALVFLLLRAFSSGCAALTGVEAISNCVPAFRKPKGRNAAATLGVLGLLAMLMFAGVTGLAYAVGAKFGDPSQGSHLYDPSGREVTADPVIIQVARTVFDHFPFGVHAIAVVTGLILVLAANTAFNGFPVLGSVLAQSRYLPRQLHTRGDRLAFSNGILLLAVAAGALIHAFDAEVTRLVQLYIVGVFVAFTVSQYGMVRHWNRELARERDPRRQARMRRSRAVNAFGGFLTGLVLIVVLVSKFTHGAWIAVAIMVLLFLLMRGIRRHYDNIAAELAVPEGTYLDESIRPARNHAIVLVSQIHKPTLRSLAYAQATRPYSLEALTVAVDAEEARRLQEEWEARGIEVPLKILDSPYREITRPVLDYVRKLRRRSPRDVITVFIPEYVVGRWWEHLLHNQSALRLKGRLLFQPGVMVTSVPWQLRSSDRRTGHSDRDGARPVRRPAAGRTKDDDRDGR